IPVVPMAGGSRLRLIAGEFAGQRGAAQTFSPIDVWDMHLTRDAAITLPLMEGRSVALVVLRGTLKVNGEQPVHATQTVLFEHGGDEIVLEAGDEAQVLLLSGE